MNGFNTFEKQDKVLIGMSGGVDSSVAVHILQEQGFAVQGAVIRFSPAHEGAVAAARWASAGGWPTRQTNWAAPTLLPAITPAST